MTSAHGSEGASLVSPPEHAEAVASLRSGQDFTHVLVEDPRLRSAATEAILAAIADEDTRVVRAGNPLRSPLTIERLLIQAVGPDAGLTAGLGADRDPAELTRLLAEAHPDGSRLILVVEDAETLDAEAVRVLRLMSRSFRQGRPVVQVLFAGHPSFRKAWDGDAQAAAPVAAAPVRNGAPSAMPASAPATRWRPTWLIAALIPAMLLAGAGAYWLAYPGAFRARPSSPPPAVQRATLPAPAPSAAPASPATPAPPATPASPATPALPATPAPPAAADPDLAARLRAEFDQFLAASGQTAARLTDAQRETLLKEFMAWRARTQTPPTPR